MVFLTCAYVHFLGDAATAAESTGSIPLSKLGPFRGNRKGVFSRHFLSRPSLYPKCPAQLTCERNECSIILQGGCACAPGLTHPPSPAVRTSELSWGTGGGPSVRVLFTN